MQRWNHVRMLPLRMKGRAATSNRSCPSEFPPDAFRARLVPDIRRWRVFHFQDTSPEAPARNSVAVRDNLCLRENGGNLAPFLRHLKERYPENHRRIVESVRLAAPFLDDFVHRVGSR